MINVFTLGCTFMVQAVTKLSSATNMEYTHSEQVRDGSLIFTMSIKGLFSDSVRAST